MNTKLIELGKAAVESIWADLMDRRGIRHELQACDADIQEEIKQDMRCAVALAAGPFIDRQRKQLMRCGSMLHELYGERRAICSVAESIILCAKHRVASRGLGCPCCRADEAERKLTEERRRHDEHNARRNRELDALHYVWCSGGCEEGTHRWTDGKPDKSTVMEAIRNTCRLVSWFVDREHKAGRECDFQGAIDAVVGPELNDARRVAARLAEFIHFCQSEIPEAELEMALAWRKP